MRSSYVTEVRELEHWNRVWYMESTLPCSLALSPDAKKGAVSRLRKLEIQLFVEDRNVVQAPVGTK